MKRVRAHKKAQDERKLCEEQKAEIEQVVCFGSALALAVRTGLHALAEKQCNSVC